MQVGRQSKHINFLGVETGRDTSFVPINITSSTTYSNTIPESIASSLDERMSRERPGR